MKYFLDTNIIIYFINGKYSEVARHFEQVPQTSIVIPSMVVGEIEYGACKSRDYAKTIELYRKFIDPFEVVPFSSSAVATYGEIRSDLEKRGETIGANDLVIAATVLGEGGTLVTHNTKEFSRVAGLTVADWTEA
ncbi:MAG: type II toxin-antitoxin system VapC family toxin [Mobiluncus porci]|uniref:Ribonuclease VapC n=1 Tax=Mobiluncus porci TaxID=2652278 RepID=A0A7K0JZT6_9ACTO|nr:type II toxin-antitoxin system VapC family toxin [Mobiluncus porci]MDD7542231.1 type II toxin-antitoxin system VapC family toxin [Mobiluncus porci]MDY5749030.1 type II toxin-antitoxin system VapC family toxin [Mobiluncus porci]MST48659.1 type II toxin-antitoxin system VapC family toxin [Mobiluncus porci]